MVCVWCVSNRYMYSPTVPMYGIHAFVFAYLCVCMIDKETPVYVSCVRIIYMLSTPRLPVNFMFIPPSSVFRSTSDDCCQTITIRNVELFMHTQRVIHTRRNSEARVCTHFRCWIHADSHTHSTNCAHTINNHQN